MSAFTDNLSYRYVVYSILDLINGLAMLYVFHRQTKSSYQECEPIKTVQQINYLNKPQSSRNNAFLPASNMRTEGSDADYLNFNPKNDTENVD